MTADDRPIAYVLLSGGIDSATCVSIAASLVGQKNVRAVSMDYGQRHHREIEAARAVMRFWGREQHHHTIQIPMPKTMLTSEAIEVPSTTYAEIVGVSPMYVPFRNGLMLSTLTSYVAGRHLDKTNDGEDDYNRDCLIYFGAHAEDAAGGAYPDCTLEFVGAMANAIERGTYGKVRLQVPLIHMMKDEIIKLGAQLGVPYHLTWSCYKGESKHCGVCATCNARKEGFRFANVKDPTEYAY